MGLCLNLDIEMGRCCHEIEAVYLESKKRDEPCLRIDREGLKNERAVEKETLLEKREI